MLLGCKHAAHLLIGQPGATAAYPTCRLTITINQGPLSVERYLLCSCDNGRLQKQRCHIFYALSLEYQNKLAFLIPDNGIEFCLGNYLVRTVTWHRKTQSELSLTVSARRSYGHFVIHASRGSTCLRECF